MDRRGFLRMMVGGVATAAAARTFPFRVFSFPKEIQRASFPSPFLKPLPLELLQDSAFDVGEVLRNEFARRMALITDMQIRKYLYGDAGPIRAVC